MKKLLILALSIFTVIFMATAVLAAEVSYKGKVEVTWANDPAAEEDATGFDECSREAKVFFDYTKDYGDGVTAGLKTMMEAKEAEGGGFKFDSEGWIKLDYDLFSVKASTKIGGGAGKDFGKFGLKGAPGVEVVAVPADGFTLTGVVNGGFDKGYRLLAKGEYATDLFSVGGGYQTERGKQDGDNWLAKTALGVYGSFNVMENLTVKGEYGSRNLGKTKDEKAITAILVNANYDDGVIMVDASYLMANLGFDITDDDDEWLARDVVRNGSVNGSVLYVDASYAVTDTLKVLASFDYILTALDANENGKDLTKDDDYDRLSYKLGAEAQLTDQLKAEGWYKAFGKFADDDAHAQLGAKATYTFADGVEGSFELTNGREWDDPEAYTRYTVKLTAAL